MTDLVENVSNPGALVMDPFDRTFCPAKACLSLSKHRKIVGCDVDAEIFDADLPGLLSVLSVFSKQVNNDESDITV